MTGKVSIIRARGKAVLVPLIKMLRHFKTNFGIVHDIDWPYRKNGSGNGMWTINTTIRNEIIKCRESGHIVYHRWSIPDFERFLGGDELGKDKPYAAFKRISSDQKLKERVQGLISSLFDEHQFDPIGHNPDNDFITQILEELKIWAKENNQDTNIRLLGI